ncbi:hypothetical protein [Nonomuraea dietziae]|uniref:hypothetical protein n=1 Tax=Nonomuraea dietziae TaxID=65515 RepID=UPI0034374615
MITTERPVIVLVHGAFAESASQNGVIRRLHDHWFPTLGVARPLGELESDATSVRNVIAGLGRPVDVQG